MYSRGKFNESSIVEWMLIDNAQKLIIQFFYANNKLRQRSMTTTGSRGWIKSAVASKGENFIIDLIKGVKGMTRCEHSIDERGEKATSEILAIFPCETNLFSKNSIHHFGF